MSLDPETRSAADDLDMALLGGLEGPLVDLDEIDGIESIHIAPDGQSAMLPLRLTANLPLPDTIGRSLHATAVSALRGAPTHVEVYMAIERADPCPICNRRGKHDWSKHAASADFAGGLIQL